MNRKILSAVAALALLLVGCGGNNTPAVGTTTSATTSTTTSASQSTTTSESTTVGTTTTASQNTTTTTTKISTTTTTTTSTTTTKETTTTTTTEPTSSPFNYPQKGKNYTAEATWQTCFLPPQQTHKKLQGSCYANGYWYVSFIKDDNPESGVYIVKYDECFEPVAISEPLALDHSNNLSYNPHTNQILVSHCQSGGRDRWAWYSFVDPDTLTVISTGELPNPFFSMAYSPEKKLYGSARWAGQTVDVWDKDLNHLRSFDVETPMTLSQGVFCDANYIWFVRSSTAQAPYSEIRLYDWDTGECVFVIPIDDLLGDEPESLHLVDDMLYILSDSGNFVDVFTVQLIEE